MTFDGIVIGTVSNNAAAMATAMLAMLPQLRNRIAAFERGE